MAINTYALTAQSGDTNVFSQAGIVALMGIVTIFVVLALLWVAVEIMHRVLHRDENEKKSNVTAFGNYGGFVYACFCKLRGYANRTKRCG